VLLGDDDRKQLAGPHIPLPNRRINLQFQCPNLKEVTARLRRLDCSSRSLTQQSLLELSARELLSERCTQREICDK